MSNPNQLKLEGVSPKLKKAIVEISDIYKKYDVSGVAFLADGEGNGEYKLMCEVPTWSLIEFKTIGGKPAINFKIRSKSNKVDTDKNINSFASTLGMMGQIYLMLDNLYKQLKARVDIEETDPGKIIPHQDFLENRRLDPEYDDIEKTLRVLPTTWYPALLQVIVGAAKKKGVFKDDKPLPFLEKIVQRLDE